MIHVHGDMIKEANMSNKVVNKKENFGKSETKSIQHVEEKAVVETAVTEEQPKQEKILGTVVDCNKLRIRKHPSINAIVAAEIEKGTAIMIDESKSTADFYAVITESGLEGYCMKDYVQVKQ